MTWVERNRVFGHVIWQNKFDLSFNAKSAQMQWYGLQIPCRMPSFIQIDSLTAEKVWRESSLDMTFFVQILRSFKFDQKCFGLRIRVFKDVSELEWSRSAPYWSIWKFRVFMWKEDRTNASESINLSSFEAFRASSASHEMRARTLVTRIALSCLSSESNTASGWS